MTVREIYDQTIKQLLPAERYELARMILGEIPPQAIVDYSDEWSEEDRRDFTRANWQRIESDPGYEYHG